MMTPNLTWKAQGDANQYVLLDGNKWVAYVHLNGEMLVFTQERLMDRFAASAELLAALNAQLDKGPYCACDVCDRSRAAVAKAGGAEVAATLDAAAAIRAAALEEAAQLCDHPEAVDASDCAAIIRHAARSGAVSTKPLAVDVEAACSLLENKEYAEHWAKSELGKRLETALTELHNDAAIQRDALRAVAEAVAEETTNWVANQHTLGVPNDAPDLDAIIDRVMADHPQAEPRILASARDLHAYCAERAKLLADGQPKEIEALLRGELLGVGLKCIKWLEARQAGGAA